jgi:hypothetical protein
VNIKFQSRNLKQPLGIPRHIGLSEDNIEINLQEIGCENVG